MPNSDRHAPDERLNPILSRAGGGDPAAMSELRALMQDFPEDARLHFLEGSFLASEKEYAAARTAMARAVDLNPLFYLARFQLGLLIFSSGEPAAATSVWQPLHDLDRANPFRLFAEGLEALGRDEFTVARSKLSEGIASNSDNAPLNRDMGMLITQIDALGDGPPGAPQTSEAHFLLSQFRTSTKH